MAVGQSVQCRLAIARIACAAFPPSILQQSPARRLHGFRARITCPVNAELDKMIVSAWQEAVLLRLAAMTVELDLEPVEDSSRQARGRCAGLSSISISLHANAPAMEPLRCLAIGTSPLALAKAIRREVTQFLVLRLGGQAVGGSNARIVGPDAELFLELIAHPSRLEVALARDPEQFAVEGNLIRDARRLTPARREPNSTSSPSALSTSVFARIGSPDGKHAPYRRQWRCIRRSALGEACRSQADRARSGDPCRCRAGPDRCQSPCRGGGGCRHDPGSADVLALGGAQAPPDHLNEKFGFWSGARE